MPIAINGTGTITGLSAGGLPDDCITTAEIAGSAVTTAKITDANITYGKLSNSATEADNVAKRTAKAWVNFNGTTNVGGNCTIRDDFNVSTVADNGTGNYTVNFSSSLTTSSYACVAQADSISGGGAHGFIYAESLATSNFNLQVTTGGGTRLDSTTISAVVLL